MDDKNLNHKINLIERENLNITGVLKVLSSNINNICLKLKDTDLIIIGNNLNIINFNNNNIEINGIIDIIKYSKQSKNKESFIKRVFK